MVPAAGSLSRTFSILFVAGLWENGLTNWEER